MKSGAKNTGVTVSQCHRATWKRIFLVPDNLLLRTAGKRHIKEIKK